MAAADSLGGVFARRLLLPSLLLPVLFTFAFKALQSWLGASEALAASLAALCTGGSIAWMVWWVANLLDRVERQRRESASLRDDALHRTGLLLRAALRPSDLPARYGGEEFALLLPGTDAARAQRVAERILAG